MAPTERTRYVSAPPDPILASIGRALAYTVSTAHLGVVAAMSVLTPLALLAAGFGGHEFFDEDLAHLMALLAPMGPWALLLVPRLLRAPDPRLRVAVQLLLVLARVPVVLFTVVIGLPAVMVSRYRLLPGPRPVLR